MGKVVDDWAVSGITQFQSGFPIRLDTENDNELINSIFFMGTEAPSLVAPFQKLNPKTNNGFWFNPNDFPIHRSGNSTTALSAPSAAAQAFSSGTSPCTSRSTSVRDKYFQFRARFSIFSTTRISITRTELLGRPDRVWQNYPAQHRAWCSLR